VKIGVMTDSGADLKPDEIENLNIGWLPVEIITPDGTHIRDTEDIDIEGFYKLVEKGGKFISVQLKPCEIVDKAEHMLKTYDHVLYITMSSAMSGTYENALMAQKEIGKDRLTVFDSRSISTGQAALVLKVTKDIRDGKVSIESIEKLADYLDSVRAHLRFYFVLETLDYLRDGGRIGKAQYLVGHMLKLKPALSINDKGEIYPESKLRGGKKRLISFFEKLLTEHQMAENSPLHFVHGIETPMAGAMRGWLGERGIQYTERLSRPTTTIHGGPYSTGLAWFTG